MPSPATVTGNLRQLSNGVIAQGQIVFELSNIGTGNPITVSGTGIFPALKYVTQSAADGSFSQSLWGNDNISPTNTIYNVTYRDNSGNEVGPIQYSITGGSANLNTLTAVSSTTPPVLSPGGGITLLNYQGPASGIVGTGGDVTYYTYTVGANIIGAGHGVRITSIIAHTVRGHDATYKLSFGGVLTSALAITNPDITRIVYEVFNNVGVQNAQLAVTSASDNASNKAIVLNPPDVLAANTVNAVIINVTFNGNAADTFKPEMFIVELL